MNEEFEDSTWTTHRLEGDALEGYSTDGQAMEAIHLSQSNGYRSMTQTECPTY